MQRLRSKLMGWTLLSLAAAVSATAQTSSGTVAGTITDSTGAAVSGATVTSVSNQTGERRVVTTNSVGGYRIESVTPGTFTVSAEAPGFSKANAQNVRVDASVITSVNETLSVGSNETTVEVPAEQVTLATDTGAITGTLGSTAIDNLPIQGLNPYFLALTLPGVQSVGNNAFSNGINFSVDGSRSRSNNFLIEGSDNNDAGIHGQGLQPANLDAIEQVTILENAYQAEFGGGGGSVANLIYKNGSNHFHGAAWDRILNSSLDAADKSNFFSGGSKSKYRENIFGYEIGGFAKKDKLFFFNSLQFDHYRSSTSSTLIVPTTSGIATLKSLGTNPRVANLLAAISTLQGADFTPTQVQAGVSGSTNFSCIPITETTAPTAFCPTGNAVAVGPVTRSIPLNTNSPELDNKVEYIPNQKDTLVFRFIRTTYTAPTDAFNYPSQLPGFDTTQYGKSYNAGVTETHIFNPHLLNDLRISYGRIGFIFDFQPQTYANPLGVAPTTGIPGITGFGAPGGDPQSRQHNTYQLQDALSWNISGRHALKIGADVSNVRVRDAVPFNLYGSISYAATTGFSGLANYIDDFGGKNGSVSQNFGSPVARPQMYNQNYYIQDTWKAAENLTVELGFRYEYEGAPFNTVAYPAFDLNNPACTNPGVTNKIASFCKVSENPDKSDWGPRFGFAYTPAFLGKKTVLRGGFGMFYDGLFTNIIDNTQASSPNAAAPDIISTITTANPRGLPNFSANLTNGSLNKSPLVTDTIESMSPNIRSPRTLQWNLNVQQDLGHGFISQLGYVGTRGEHLYATTESNPVDPFNTGARLFPELGRVIIRDNSGDSIYHSAQAEINRSFSHGFLMRASYTWAKFEDDVSEIFTSGNASTYGMFQYPFPRKKIDYGQSALDVRHRLALTYVYAPPAWHPQGLLKIASNVVNGFQFTGVNIFASGNPGNVEVGYDYNGDGIGNDRPSLSNPNAPLATYAFDRATYYDGNPGLCDGPTLWYIGSCKTVTPQQVHYLVPAEGGALGTTVLQPVIQRNSFRTLGNQEQDLTVQRSFHIHESQNFDLRAEVFNVFNQGTTGTPNLTLTSINPNPAVYGTNNFADFAPTLSGHRNLRFYLKYRF